MRTGERNRVMVAEHAGSSLAEVVGLAASAIGSGRLIIAPTETVYGVFASARSAEGLRLLDASRRSESQESQDPAYTWHAASAEAIERVIDLPTPVHQRLVRGLMPGPVRLVLEQESASLDRLHAELGVEPGVITTIGDGSGRERAEGSAIDRAGTGTGGGTGWLAVRVPDHRVAAMLLEACDGPVVAVRLGGTRFGGDSRPDQRVADQQVLDDAGFDGMILDAGTIPASPPSTTVHARLSGAFEVSEGGAVSEDRVMAALRRTILFVCTGNTCRSPMAEAIARAIVARTKAGTEDGTETVVASAGVMAGNGMPATPEALDAAKDLGGDLSNHRSRGLTPAMVAEAERVYVMTSAHGDRAKAMVSGLDSDKIERLDPDNDIPDPIGGSPAVYRETAERIRAAIEKRFEELGL